MTYTIRPASPADAEGLLRAHHSAVHVTAKRDYPAAMLQVWSPPVDELRILAKQARLEPTYAPTVISYVAVSQTGEVLGMGELVPPDTLGALYVSAGAGGQGVASALLRAVEARAREMGFARLRMDSSLTAAGFYSRRGYLELGRGAHQLAGGVHMACVHMEKIL